MRSSLHSDCRKLLIFVYIVNCQVLFHFERVNEALKRSPYFSNDFLVCYFYCQYLEQFFLVVFTNSAKIIYTPMLLVCYHIICA